MREFYGSTPYPTPPMSRLQALAADIMETAADDISDVVFDPVSRSDVGQGPLLKVNAMNVSVSLTLLIMALKNEAPPYMAPLVPLLYYSCYKKCLKMWAL